MYGFCRRGLEEKALTRDDRFSLGRKTKELSIVWNAWTYHSSFDLWWGVNLIRYATGSALPSSSVVFILRVACRTHCKQWIQMILIMSDQKLTIECEKVGGQIQKKQENDEKKGTIHQLVSLAQVFIVGLPVSSCGEGVTGSPILRTGARETIMYTWTLAMTPLLSLALANNHHILIENKYRGKNIVINKWKISKNTALNTWPSSIFPFFMSWKLHSNNKKSLVKVGEKLKAA